MITFQETVDAIERLAELLKSAAEAQSTVEHAVANMAAFRSMLEYSHVKEFQDVDEALSYIDHVLVPQLNGILDALESGTEPHFKRLEMASDHAKRLAVRLQMLTDSSGAGFLG
jgi:uncharacterized protein YpiB (UPF0302 family)